MRFPDTAASTREDLSAFPRHSLQPELLLPPEVFPGGLRTHSTVNHKPEEAADAVVMTTRSKKKIKNWQNAGGSIPTLLLSLGQLDAAPQPVLGASFPSPRGCRCQKRGSRSAQRLGEGRDEIPRKQPRGVGWEAGGMEQSLLQPSASQFVPLW